MYAAQYDRPLVDGMIVNFTRGDKPAKALIHRNFAMPSAIVSTSVP